MATFLKDVLELAVAIEHECAAVYETFARRFADDGEFSAFWRLYAEAERYHGATIRIHQATFGNGAAADGDQFNAEAAESERFLEQLRGWRTKYASGPITRAEAFAVAKDIEGATAELHGRTQFFRLYPRFQELFARMTEEDTQHRAMLGDAEGRFLKGKPPSAV